MDIDLKKGIELIKQVDNTAAVSFLLKALKKDPLNPEIFRHLGLAFFNLGNFEEALINWKKAIELDPTHHQTIWSLGNLHEIEHRNDEAFQYYIQAAEVAKEGSHPKKAERYRE
ncbi:MAG: tetratricopeptide repeat protein, partial [Candidatus Hodarchaeota archaeon]